jgi:prephenate dehydratase
MREKSLGFLGPPGTFSEEAAFQYTLGHRRRLIECPTIAAVLEQTAGGLLDEGIVPLENSLEGGVAVTLDLLAGQAGIYIRQELMVPVHHCLVGAPGIYHEDIHRVYSHPHALAQCRQYLEQQLMNVSCQPTESTAAAAKLVSVLPGTAAIAPRRTAQIFKLQLLAENIEDNNENVTRFIIAARKDHEPTGRDKTSLVLSVADGPGSLYNVLGYFARAAVNLTRIESRPARRSLGDWLFFIDCEGHRLETKLQQLWEDLSRTVPFLKLLGSYPIADHTTQNKG